MTSERSFAHWYNEYDTRVESQPAATMPHCRLLPYQCAAVCPPAATSAGSIKSLEDSHLAAERVPFPS